MSYVSDLVLSDNTPVLHIKRDRAPLPHEFVAIYPVRREVRQLHNPDDDPGPLADMFVIFEGQRADGQTTEASVNWMVLGDDFAFAMRLNNQFGLALRASREHYRFAVASTVWLADFENMPLDDNMRQEAGTGRTFHTKDRQRRDDDLRARFCADGRLVETFRRLSRDRVQVTPYGSLCNA